MATITVELPDALAQQAEQRGLSQQQMEQIVVQLVRLYFDQADNAVLETPPSAPSDQPWRAEAEAFARRMIARNRALFEELACL